ncbi:MAG: hypothetical protein M3Z66_08875 [Chloroflexota bacterium]|nr:hypothetical protein [Chloroflexota bacterium]
MLREKIIKQAADLSDEGLMRELRCAQRYADCTTRTRRDLARLCVRCLREEIERRQASHAPEP